LIFPWSWWTGRLYPDPPVESARGVPVFTNGYAEGVINKVKVIKRRAYGLPTFSGFRKRVVIACG
jgi:hypothetical protein